MTITVRTLVLSVTLSSAATVGGIVLVVRGGDAPRQDAAQAGRPGRRDRRPARFPVRRNRPDLLGRLLPRPPARGHDDQERIVRPLPVPGDERRHAREDAHDRDLPGRKCLAGRQRAAQERGARHVKLSDGRVAVWRTSRPTSVYIATRGSNTLVEVFDPSAAKAHNLLDLRPGAASRTGGVRQPMRGSLPGWLAALAVLALAGGPSSASSSCANRPISRAARSSRSSGWLAHERQSSLEWQAVAAHGAGRTCWPTRSRLGGGRWTPSSRACPRSGSDRTRSSSMQPRSTSRRSATSCACSPRAGSTRRSPSARSVSTRASAVSRASCADARRFGVSAQSASFRATAATVSSSPGRPLQHPAAARLPGRSPLARRRRRARAAPE